MSYVYDLTEEEKRAVRTMLALRLAKHGVTSSIAAEDLLEGLGAGPEGRACLKPLAAALATCTVTEIRNGVPDSFLIFKTLEPVEVLRGQPFWRYSFTRKFLQFCIGRHL